ncbi:MULTISPECIES: hydroxymethylbilane synthase [unclassified Frankia]|uniref:hydroxymethylbilane synthase n=1 Tax=unclassified Frankia TaxID=2632575 RepID=UPI002AD35C10|nr:MULTISPECIES: hydroxymethylbilane synthase [unclassified Frankia]
MTSGNRRPGRPDGESVPGPTGRRDALRLGTRGSALALAQSSLVASWLRERLGRQVELVHIVTAGDRSQEAISQLGGTGVFVSALREALVAGEIDLAVHSLKDLPTATPDGLVIAAVPPRADPRDVVVTPSGRKLSDLGPGGTVGTGSPRRAAQLRALGLGLNVVPIRGNVDTRIKKAIDGAVDAVVLAHAGLDRLDRLDAVTEVLDADVMVPAAGQGALAIECAGDPDVLDGVFDRADLYRGNVTLAELLRFVLDDPLSRTAVAAERAYLAAIEAGCSAPVGALADVAVAPEGAMAAGVIRLRAVVASPEGNGVLRRVVTGPAHHPEALGERLADAMLSAGAQTLMGNF